MNRAANLLRTALVSQVSKRTAAHYGYAGPLKGTMNDLPQPCGNFKTKYDARQRKYNAQLMIGITFFIVTLAFGQSMGYFYLNGTVPAKPSGKLDYGK